VDDGESTISKVVAIRIRSADSLTYTDSNGLDLRPNKYVVVQGQKGPELGQVIRNPQDVVYAQTEDKMLPTVLRVATGSDLGNLQRNQELEREAFGVARSKVRDLGLAMKIDTRVGFGLAMPRGAASGGRPGRSQVDRWDRQVRAGLMLRYLDGQV